MHAISAKGGGIIARRQPCCYNSLCPVEKVIKHFHLHCFRSRVTTVKMFSDVPLSLLLPLTGILGPLAISGLLGSILLIYVRFFATKGPQKGEYKQLPGPKGTDSR